MQVIDSLERPKRVNDRLLIQPLAPALGAEISGVDLSRPLSADSVDRIRRAFVDHGVIFFRDQHLSPEQHIAFAQNFGEINVNRFFRAVEGHPMIAEVRKDAEHKKNIGGEWHTDHSYDEIPALGSVLLAHEVPQHRRRHGLRQHVRGLRGALRWPQGRRSAAACRPFQPACVRS